MPKNDLMNYMKNGDAKAFRDHIRSELGGRSLNAIDRRAAEIGNSFFNGVEEEPEPDTTEEGEE